MPQVIVVTGRTNGTKECGITDKEFYRPSFTEKLNPVLAELASQHALYDTIYASPEPDFHHMVIVVHDQPAEAIFPARAGVDPDKLYKIPEAAAILNYAPATIGDHARSGKIASVTLGRARRIPGHEIARLLGQPVSV